MPPKASTKRKSPAKGAKGSKGKKGRAAKESTPSVAVAAVSPSPSKANAVFVAFVLENGERRGFATNDEATEFRDDYESLITDERTFPTKAKMNAFVKVSTPTKAKRDVVDLSTDAACSPEDKLKIDRILSGLEKDKPADTFHMGYKTTKNSTIAYAFLRPMDDKGDPKWFMKPPIHKVLKAFFHEYPPKSTPLKQFFANISLVVERDPAKGPEDPMFSIRKHDQKEFKQFVMVTHFDLEMGVMTSRDDEAAVIASVLRGAMSCIRQAEKKTEVFQRIVKGAYTERMYAAMTDPLKNYSGTFYQYLRSCRLQIEPVVNMNSIIILDDVKTIKLNLFESEKKPGKKKYVPTVKTEKTDSDSEHSQEEAAQAASADAVEVEAQVLEDQSEAEVELGDDDTEEEAENE